MVFESYAKQVVDAVKSSSIDHSEFGDIITKYHSLFLIKTLTQFALLGTS